MSIPNLDVMTKAELEAFCEEYHGGRRSRKLFRGLDGDRRYIKNYTARLVAYACNKVKAMELREQGLVNEALRYEGLCEVIYKNLPEFVRW